MPAMKAFTMLPRAAEVYRRHITLGLEGEPRPALKARSILRKLFGGKIRFGSRARRRADSSLEPSHIRPSEDTRDVW